ncbi:hypothetical protein OHW35_08015 [Acinetobacter baumannii]|nr:hypothetical protein [Acinetobacter baumannii]MDV7431461.1 hypothetical protein [Acinetobacter baumannii]HCE0436867.1 hypothetical protein [Acinetobacter baumannii]
MIVDNAAMKIKFIRRPAPVFVEHRPIYKIGQIMLILYISSRGYKSSLTRLHLFNWVLKEEKRKENLINSLKGGNLKISAWGFDPALTIAIRFAIAEKLLFEESTGYKLSELEIQFSKEIMSDSLLFTQEKEFLLSIKKALTEAMVESVAKSWKSL